MNRKTRPFIEQFIEARSVSTPLLTVRTADASSTIMNCQKALEASSKADEPALLVQWDSIHGLRSIGKPGSAALSEMLTAAGIADAGATQILTIALGVLEFAKADIVAFIHNVHLHWDGQDKANVLQAIWNLRNIFKSRGNMLVNLTHAGTILPTELQADVLLLDEELPTRKELAKIVRDVYAYASQNADWKVPAKPDEKIIPAATDALIGLPAFPSDQATAMCLDKKTGILDINALWDRKRSIIGQMPGLKFHQGTETLADAAGLAPMHEFGRLVMNSPEAPTVLLRMDEIEKQFAGNSTDSSGVKGDLLGEWLTWINDRKIFCSLFLGVPGSSKSWFTYCLGGEYNKPVIDYSVSAMQHHHVGVSSANMRNAHRSIEAISDCRIALFATANSLRGLPPELISRFQVGGIFFFDAPDAQERAAIMKLKIAVYGLESDQNLPDTTNWTGRDIDNCARKAKMFGTDLMTAAKFVVPLLTSHKEDMEQLRASASHRYLSANRPGVYSYMGETPAEPQSTVVTTGRKMR